MADPDADHHVVDGAVSLYFRDDRGDCTEYGVCLLYTYLIIKSAKKTGRVVTVEEHSVIGGLGSAVCDALSENAPVPVYKIGVRDVDVYKRQG